MLSTEPGAGHRLIPSSTLIRVAATNFLDSSPEREHASFYLGTGITGKASPCLLRSFDDTVPHPWFRLAQGVADRWCSRGKSPSCSPTDERKRHIVVTHATLRPSGQSNTLSHLIPPSANPGISHRMGPWGRACRFPQDTLTAPKFCPYLPIENQRVPK